ncbi:hypothetical protein [Microseira wollei]|uniref:hypothetical protein n=1 Tax=Microseira wollei TaxID=467598 RepID=UPI001CFCD717|nr:hypothetical protein [Microseira wollei]
MGKSTTWLSGLLKKLGDAFPDAIAPFDPDGYRWKWRQGKFRAWDEGAVDDNGSKALAAYN